MPYSGNDIHRITKPENLIKEIGLIEGITFNLVSEQTDRFMSFCRSRKKLLANAAEKSQEESSEGRTEGEMI